MNIAFFIPELSNKGGVEVSTINLINALAKNSNVQVSLILFSNDSFVADIDSVINIIFLNIIDYKKQYLTLITRFRNSVIKNEIDVVVTVESMSYLFSFIPLITLRNRPKIVVWEHFNYKNDNGRKSRGVLRLLAAKTADLIILLTQRDVDEWEKNIKMHAGISYIPNISTFDRAYNNYDLNSKTIISIGRYTQVKGFDRLIDIWRIFQNKYNISDWNLNIIGYGSDKEYLQSLIDDSKLKSINLISSDNIDINYANSSFYCMTSYFEGLPMVLIEAQSFGLPSIAFDIFTGPSEILDESTGILIKDNDLEAYADAIYKLISDSELRVRMSINAFKAKNRYSKKTIAEKWFHELENII